MNEYTLLAIKSASNIAPAWIHLLSSLLQAPRKRCDALPLISIKQGQIRVKK